MSQHKDVTLLTHSMTDRTQKQTPEAERRQCHDLTYPDVIAKPGEVLLRAVIVTDLLVTAAYMIGREKQKKKSNVRE